MENDIIRERLKGLYVAIDSLTGIGAAKGVMAGELGIMAIRVKEVAELLEKTESLLSSVVAERDEFQGDNMELVQMRHEIAEEKTKLAKTAKDRITSLQKHLQAAEEERDKLKVERDQQEKQLHDLSEEFSKLRNRLTQYHQRRKAYGEAEERVCKLCQKVFLDTENYNWSCRTHQSEFGGEIWWCCGKPGKDAAGCRISKHESKEEDEEAELAKKEEEAQRQSLQKCPSCKGYGHQPSDCPKDPNYRSKFDLADESHRLDRILGTKRKHTLPSPEFSVLALNTLIGQSDVREFNDKDPVTSNSESPITDEDGEGLAAFPDIKDMKSRVPKQRSAVSLDQAIQNNEEKPLLQTFSVRVKRVSKTRSMQNSPRAEGRKNSEFRLIPGHRVG